MSVALGGEQRGRKDPLMTMLCFGHIQDSQNIHGSVPLLTQPQCSHLWLMSMCLASLQTTKTISNVCLTLQLRSTIEAAFNVLLQASDAFTSGEPAIHLYGWVGEALGETELICIKMTVNAIRSWQDESKIGMPLPFTTAAVTEECAGRRR